jgi:hypothetical protein
MMRRGTNVVRKWAMLSGRTIYVIGPLRLKKPNCKKNGNQIPGQIAWPSTGKRRSLGKISVNYLCIPFSEHFEQPMSIAQHVNRILLVCRFDGIF